MLRVRVSADIYPQSADPYGFSRWSSYTIEHDLRSVFPTVRLTAAGKSDVPARLLEALEENPTIRVRVDGTLQATCRVTSDVSALSKRGGVSVSLIGSGLTQILAVDAMPLGWRPAGMTILEACQDIARPKGIEVVSTATQAQEQVSVRRVTTRTYSDTSVAHLGGYLPGTATTAYTTETIIDDRKLRPRVGDTRLSYLRRLIAGHGLHCWETPDGKLFVGKPQPADALPYLSLRTGERDAGEGRIVEVSRQRRYGTQHTSIRVVGRGGHGGERTVDATATDDGLIARGWTEALALIEAPDLRGNPEAQKRADMAMASERLAAYEVQVKLAGHGLGAALAACDRNVSVDAPRMGLVNARCYCIRRTFEHGRTGGTTASMTLIRRGLWEPTA